MNCFPPYKAIALAVKRLRVSQEFASSGGPQENLSFGLTGCTTLYRYHSNGIRNNCMKCLSGEHDE